MMYFQRGLNRLKQRVLEMGALAESMAADASRALVTGDAALVQQVRAREPMVDQFQVEIDREAVRLITIYAPVARDLRFLLMIVRINSELERIGDQAFDNCDYLELLPRPRPQLDDLSQISGIVLGMVRDALEAFRDEDTRKARAVMEMDDRVDALDAQVFRSLLEHPAADAGSRAASLGLILVARSLERIADHATNICEEVFYLVEGTDVRHQNAEIAPVVKPPSSASRQ
jgi:phosphate transport system protein